MTPGSFFLEHRDRAIPAANDYFLDGPLAVEDAQRPADRLCRLGHALRHPGDTAVGEIGGHEDDQAWTLRGRPAQRAAVITGRLQGGSDRGLRPLDGRIGGARCRGMAGASGRGDDQGGQQRGHEKQDRAPSRRARRGEERLMRPPGGDAWALTQCRPGAHIDQ